MSWRRKGSLRWGWICLLTSGILAVCVAQGTANRKWSIRKTGEFGRKLETTTVPEELPSVKQFRLHEPNLQTAESNYNNFLATEPIRKPSLSLELPRLIPGLRSSDQEAQETGEGDGYAYANPEEDQSGYNYQAPDPIANVADQQQEQEIPKDTPDYPNPSEPDVVGGLPIGTPFQREQEEDIDSQGSRPKRPRPSSPQVVADHSDSSQCHDDSDPNCWPHGYKGVISGEAGTDYPILSEIVPTDFSCDQQQFSGYYADTDERARCQIFHVCLKGNRYRKTQQWSFLCPNGTLYSQNDFVCVWWTEAPECTDATVRSLYSLNEQLGWDNVTEGENFGGRVGGGGNRNSNLELQPASSAVSSRNSAFARAPSPVPTTFRPASFSTRGSPSARTSHPYRVPVKVNGEAGRARTKLQEVTQNALHGSAHELDYGDDTEHEVEESSQFETSLRQQSESRHKSKSGSALHKSTSEAYELKGSPDGIQPFVVNRPGQDGHQGQTELPEQVGGFDDSHQVVMMPSMQRYPDGSEGYAEVPVMLPHGTTDASEEGYRYPVPHSESTSTPAPTYLPPLHNYASGKLQDTGFTTTENYPTPTIPTEPSLSNDNFDYSTTTEQPSTTTEQAGYRYPNPTSTDQSSGYRYTNPTTTEQSGYQYPNPTTTDQSTGYRYTNPTTTDNSVGYKYTDPSTTSDQTSGYVYTNPTTDLSAGYVYTNPTTTEQNVVSTNPTTTEQSTGYVYTNPTTDQSTGYVYTNPTTTEQSTTESPQSEYQYPSLVTSQQLRETEAGYNYPTPTSTPTTQSTTIVTTPTEDYQVTNNDVVTADYQPDTTRSPDIPRPQYGVPEQLRQTTTTSNPNEGQDLLGSTLNNFISTTNSPESTPAGGYLPPKGDTTSTQPPSQSTTQQKLEDDTVEIPGESGEGDYEDEENEVTDTTGPSDEGGYSYGVPTPPSSATSQVILNGGNLGTYSQLYNTKLRERIRNRQKQILSGLFYNGNPPNTDSDDKLNEILRQIQAGGIEAVDSSGKPIGFSQLKNLLLNSPRGTVELKAGAVDSATSSSTESSSKQPLSKAPTSSSQVKEDPYYHTVTTATVTNNDNTNNIFTSSGAGAGSFPAPSGFYLPPNTDNNNPSNNNQQQYYQLSSNAQLSRKPNFEIKLPNREFESHFVDSNAIENGANKNTNVFSTSQQIQYSQQQAGFQSVNHFQENQAPARNNHVQYETSQLRVAYSTQASPQQEFFQSPTPSGVVVPSGSYLPPRGQQEYERQSVLTNLVVPAVSGRQQQQQQQTFRIESVPGHTPQVPERQYLPPRQATSSILQPQYYNAEATQNSGQFLSQPVQLTENIQLQQSFARPLPPQTISGNRNPLSSKEIKIVPALFVHQHTSVATQNDPDNIRVSSDNTLEASQSTYQPSTSRFGARNSLAQQLNQIATNSQYLPQQSSRARQFTRRSNGASSPSSSGSSPAIQKLPRVSTFTLEDARSTEDLQKYHHQDLKRFHSETILKNQDSPTEDSPKSPIPSSSSNSPRSSSSSLRIRNNNDNEKQSRQGRVSSSITTSNSNNSSYPSRFSIVDTHNSRSKLNEDFFIPVSGSFAGGSDSLQDSSRSRSNSGSSRTRSGGGGGNRGFLLDSESESTLLSRFLPEEEGGFGARLL